VYLLTCPGVGQFHDERELVEAFAKQGIIATYANWQDLKLDGTPLAIRTPWDYTEHRGAFAALLDGIEASGTPCLNPVKLMRWNMDKRYLLELQEKGHQIVPTVVVEEYSRAAVRAAAEAQGWRRFIAKPTVAAGGEGLVMFDENGATEFNQTGVTWMTNPSHPVGRCLVQPMLDEIRNGEHSLFFFGGEFSHAILKTPAAGDIRVQEEHGGTTVGTTPPPQVLAAATAIVAEVPDATYARVDGVIEDGEFLLMELELIEPELYFRCTTGGEDRFARAVLATLRA
jgi:glutathione synthase/RimK-type ligase-like ATP-grasp enzyme